MGKVGGRNRVSLDEKSVISHNLGFPRKVKGGLNGYFSGLHPTSDLKRLSPMYTCDVILNSPGFPPSTVFWPSAHPPPAWSLSRKKFSICNLYQNQKAYLWQNQGSRKPSLGVTAAWLRQGEAAAEK